MPAQQRDPATPCACRGPDSRTRVGDLERTASPVVVRGQDWSGRAAVGAWLTKPKPDYWMSDSQSRKTDGPCARPPVLEGAVALLGLCREKATQSTDWGRSEEHTSELQSLMRISYAVFCLKNKITSYLQCFFTISTLQHHNTETYSIDSYHYV